MCDPPILLFHKPNIELPLAIGPTIFIVYFPHLSCVNLDISKDLCFLCQKSFAAMVSSIFYFSMHLLEGKETTSHQCIQLREKLICCSITFCCCANFSTNLNCVCNADSAFRCMYKQITTGWHLTKTNCSGSHCNLSKQENPTKLKPRPSLRLYHQPPHQQPTVCVLFIFCDKILIGSRLICET